MFGSQGLGCEKEREKQLFKIFCLVGIKIEKNVIFSQFSYFPIFLNRSDQQSLPIFTSTNNLINSPPRKFTLYYSMTLPS